MPDSLHSLHSFVITHDVSDNEAISAIAHCRYIFYNDAAESGMADALAPNGVTFKKNAEYYKKIANDFAKEEK